jgi:hypothetical protein
MIEWVARVFFLLYFMLLIVGSLAMSEQLKHANGNAPPPEKELAECLKKLLFAIEGGVFGNERESYELIGRCKIALRDAGQRGLIQWP